MDKELNSEQILAIERPDSRLMTYYFISSLVFPPFSLVALPFLYFRYHTMRYRFDDEGISMSCGLLFRKQVNLTYARIQDIHLTSGIIQRWMGLADIHIQTASGSSSAEMKLEGLLDFEDVRDFLYTKMRGYTKQHQVAGKTSRVPAAGTTSGTVGADELAVVLREIQAEVRMMRESMESRSEDAQEQRLS